MAAHDKPTIEPIYVSLEDAGIRTGLHSRTIRRAIANGELPGYKVSTKAIRVRLEDLDRWVESKAMPNARTVAPSRTSASRRKLATIGGESA